MNFIIKMSTNIEIQEREDKNIYESLHKKGVLDNIKVFSD